MPSKVNAAFGNTWVWDETANEAYQETVEAGGRISEALQAFRKLLGASNMLAYLEVMAPRLVELRRVLKPTGSIYLHCDPTASHYLKLVMDAVFDPRNFKNEIVWKRTSAHSDSKKFGNSHDIILYYCKSDKRKFNRQYQVYDEKYVDSHYSQVDKNGRRYMADNLTATGLSGGGYEYKWHGVTRIWRCPGQFRRCVIWKSKAESNIQSRASHATSDISMRCPEH